MSTIYLVGSEDVRAAGNAMTHAANEMQRAAGTIESALDRHRMWMDDWSITFLGRTGDYPTNGTMFPDDPHPSGKMAK